MQLRKELFWDSDFSQIRVDEHKDIIVQRTIDFGSLTEIENLSDFYSETEVITSLINNSELSLTGCYFSCAYFGKELNEFKCYRLRQSSPIRMIF